MSYGVTSEGFVVKRLEDILSEIESDELNTFGAVLTTPDSVLGNLNGVFSKVSADVWEVLEDVYNSLYPSTAENAALDNVLDLSGGLRRIAASESTVVGVLLGAEGTLIPAGSQAKLSETGTIFETLADVTISKATVLKTVIEITEATSGHIYHAYIDAVDYPVTAGALDDEEDIALALATYINSNQSEVTAVTDGAEISITRDDLSTTFSIDVGATKMSLNERWTPANFSALITGAIPVAVNSLDAIVTPVSGWSEVDNPSTGITGTDIESDAEARLRRANSLKVIGAGTLEAVRTRVLNDVADVVSVAAFENRTDITDGDGRPPHSFQLVVVGGLDQDIGDKIWEVKPAGIETYGEVLVDAIDSNGDNQIMMFSRPIPKYVYVEATITLYSEEQFPINGKQMLKDAIFAFGEMLPLGKDLIIQRWLIPIFTVPGIATVTLRHAAMSNESDPPAWSSVNAAIGSASIAVMDLTRITILP